MMKGLKQRNDFAKMMSVRQASLQEGEKNGLGGGGDAALPPFNSGAEPRVMSCGAAHCAVSVYSTCSSLASI